MEQRIINLIKSIRILNNYSQNEMAKVSGITISTYNIKETGKRPFKMKDVFNIFNKFGIFLQIESKIIRTNIELIRAIIKYRNDRNITQDCLRRHLEISHASYVKRETNQISFTLPELVKICQILDLKLIVKYNIIENGHYKLVEY